VRFALLPHLKPIVVPREGSVVLLALEYLNADLNTCNFNKLADGSYPPLRWKLGYVRLSLLEFEQLNTLALDHNSLYDCDLVIVVPWLGDLEIHIKRRNLPAWKRDPEVAKKVEKAAERLAREGGKLLIEKIAPTLLFPGQATVSEWDDVMARARLAKRRSRVRRRQK